MVPSQQPGPFQGVCEMVPGGVSHPGRDPRRHAARDIPLHGSASAHPGETEARRACPSQRARPRPRSRHSRFSRFRGALGRAAYATACLRAAAAAKSSSSERGEEGGGTRGAQRLHPAPPASWRGGDLVATVTGPTLAWPCQGGTDAWLPRVRACVPPPCTPGVILGWEKGSGETGSSGDNSRGRRVSPLPAPSRWQSVSRGTGLGR